MGEVRTQFAPSPGRLSSIADVLGPALERALGLPVTAAPADPLRETRDALLESVRDCARHADQLSARLANDDTLDAVQRRRLERLRAKFDGQSRRTGETAMEYGATLEQVHEAHAQGVAIARGERATA